MKVGNTIYEGAVEEMEKYHTATEQCLRTLAKKTEELREYLDAVERDLEETPFSDNISEVLEYILETGAMLSEVEEELSQRYEETKLKIRETEVLILVEDMQEKGQREALIKTVTGSTLLAENISIEENTISAIDLEIKERVNVPINEIERIDRR